MCEVVEQTCLVPLSPFSLPSIGAAVVCTLDFKSFDRRSKRVPAGDTGTLQRFDRDHDALVEFASSGACWVGQEEFHCLSQRLPLDPASQLSGRVTKAVCYGGCSYASRE